MRHQLSWLAWLFARACLGVTVDPRPGGTTAASLRRARDPARTGGLPLFQRTRGGRCPFAPSTASTVPLDQVTSLFGAKVTEGTLAGGLIIETRGQRILAVPGQSSVQAAGRVVQLRPGHARAERLVRAGGLHFARARSGHRPAHPDRRPSRLILIGDVRIRRSTSAPNARRTAAASSSTSIPRRRTRSLAKATACWCGSTRRRSMAARSPRRCPSTSPARGSTALRSR